MARFPHIVEIIAVIPQENTVLMKQTMGRRLFLPAWVDERFKKSAPYLSILFLNQMAVNSRFKG